MNGDPFCNCVIFSWLFSDRDLVGSVTVSKLSCAHASSCSSYSLESKNIKHNMLLLSQRSTSTVGVHPVPEVSHLHAYIHSCRRGTHPIFAVVRSHVSKPSNPHPHCRLQTHPLSHSHNSSRRSTSHLHLPRLISTPSPMLM